MKVSQLLTTIKAKKLYGQIPDEVTHIEVDSRKVTEHSVFVASRGYTVDSHQFIPNVIAQGCKVIVVNQLQPNIAEDVLQIVVKDTLKVASIFAQAIYNYPSKQLTTYGVTGTNGKTSVATMIHHLNRALNIDAAYLGTNGFQINESSAKGTNSTPETITLNHYINEALSQNVKAMSMEVSSHGLALGRVNGVHFDVAIFTNLTQDHLDFHGTMERYGFHKSLLFAGLGHDFENPSYAVVNGDDAYSKEITLATPREVITYGINEDVDFKAFDIQASLSGTSFKLNTPEGIFDVHSPYLGLFNVYNLTSAICALWVTGHSMAELTKVASQLDAVEGRLEVLDRNLPIDLIIDYAHTPDGMNKLIDAVQPFVKGKLIFLVGMAGERDLSKTPEMGKIACRADYVIFTPDNPANDDPKKLTDALESGATHQNFISFEDRAEGIRHAINISEPGDMVVLASKGREPYQIMHNYVKVPHRDDLIGLEAAYEKYGKTNESI